ncbi:thioredoxin family protein [bacterium]|nr:thioredoxin family protein [bacterium]
MKQQLTLLSAPWCSPCNMVKKIAKQRNLLIEVVDIDENPAIALKYGIKSIPTLLVIENDTVISQQTGNPMKIIEIIEENQ